MLPGQAEKKLVDEDMNVWFYLPVVGKVDFLMDNFYR